MATLYLDYCATTPMRDEALEEWIRVSQDDFGNPSSQHAAGRQAKQRLQEARMALADILGVAPGEVIFTGSGTEANNIAISGALQRWQRPFHVITSQIEHPAVLACFRAWERRGVDVTYLPVTRDGVVDVDTFARAVTENTRFASIMLANNEVGTLQPIAEIARICQDKGIVLHTDAVQALGKIPVHPTDLGVHLLTGSAHKFYGPKGVGLLYVRRNTQLDPILFGGGQERGLRPATENIAGICAAVVALRHTVAELEAESARVMQLRDALSDAVLSAPLDIRLSSGAQTLPHVLHVQVGGLLGEAILLGLDQMGIQVSAASACSSGHSEPSHVLTAMQAPERYIHGALRISLGRNTHAADLTRFTAALTDVVSDLRKLASV